MINQRWEKRILRAQATKGLVFYNQDVAVEVKNNEEIPVHNHVKDNEKLMNYLQKDNTSGHATNMDMLANSVNIIQHMREAILSAQYLEPVEEVGTLGDNHYLITFPFGEKVIGFKLSKKAVDSE